MLRLDEPALLAAGVAEGVIGPFGAERFDAPASYDAFRLDLAQTTPARLEARRNDAREIATISKNSRTPSAQPSGSPSDGKTNARLEVSGYEGQAFTLRGLRQSDRETFEASGPHLVGVDLAGDGGDEAPATALFARIEKDGKTRVIASDAPRIGAGKAWRGKFNLFGADVDPLRGDARRTRRDRRERREGRRLDRTGARRARGARGRQRALRAMISRRAIIFSGWSRKAIPAASST